MKTAAAIILLIALFGMFPKHKQKPGRGAASPVVKAGNCSPESQNFDDAEEVARIMKHARAIRPRSGQSDEELARVARGIVNYSRVYCLEPALAAALIAKESGYNPRATSPAGACGLGQMIPSTARSMGIADCYDVDQNLNGSLGYFRRLLDIWPGNPRQADCALAGYLVGPGKISCSGAFGGSIGSYIRGVNDYRSTMLSY